MEVTSDASVNNAGVAAPYTTETYTAHWQRIFGINLFGVVRINQAVLPSMHEMQRWPAVSRQFSRCSFCWPAVIETTYGQRPLRVVPTTVIKPLVEPYNGFHFGPANPHGGVQHR